MITKFRALVIALAMLAMSTGTYAYITESAAHAAFYCRQANLNHFGTYSYSGFTQGGTLNVGQPYFYNGRQYQLVSGSSNSGYIMGWFNVWFTNGSFVNYNRDNFFFSTVTIDIQTRGRITQAQACYRTF